MEGRVVLSQSLLSVLECMTDKFFCEQNHRVGSIIVTWMSDNLLLPIELTKILYSEWEGQLEVANDTDQLYGRSLNGPCKVTFKNGNRYEGDFKNGLLHGKGVFTWANGIVYQGDFQNNKLEGAGVYRWPDGAVYEGQVENGLRHGKGKLILDICTFEGQWKKGQRDGQGKITFTNGGVYEGEFQKGVKSGKGRMYYPTGNYYEGQWREDAKNGQGTMRWVDSHEKYTGEWLNNLQQGFGTHIWLDGRGEGKFMRNRYEGEWKAGLRHGLGVFYYANGSKYQGEWVDNMKEGVALFTNQFGNVERVIFSKDRMTKEEGRSTIKLQNNTKSSFVFNNKEIETNPYTKMLDIEELYSPLKPDMDQVYNLLLRNNSQMKGWYKNLTTIYDSKSELTFSLNLEGVWKIVRNLKVLGKISLARIDRLLAEPKPNLRNTIEAIRGMDEKFPVKDIEYLVQGNSIPNLTDSLENFESAESPVADLRETSNIHEGQKVILFKDFVHVLVIISFLLDNSLAPHKSVQKCLERVGPLLDSTMKLERKNTGESKSENISTVSKTEKNIPSYARSINVSLFNELTESTKHKFKRSMEDRSLRFMTLVQIFKEAQLFNDTTDPAMLERFLDKNLDPEFLASHSPSETSLSPKFSVAREYQLIEFQFVELIFYYLIKKLPSTKETEQNRQKYTQFIERIASAFRSMQYQRLNRIHQHREPRCLVSAKAAEKERLVEKRRMMDRLKEEQNARERERLREERERLEMEDNDVNVSCEQFESEEEEYSDY